MWLSKLQAVVVYAVAYKIIWVREFYKILVDQVSLQIYGIILTDFTCHLSIYQIQHFIVLDFCVCVYGCDFCSISLLINSIPRNDIFISGRASHFLSLFFIILLISKLILLVQSFLELFLSIYSFWMTCFITYLNILVGSWWRTDSFRELYKDRRVFPPFDYCESCCYEYWYTNTKKEIERRLFLICP